MDNMTEQEWEVVAVEMAVYELKELCAVLIGFQEDRPDLIAVERHEIVESVMKLVDKMGIKQ